MTNVNPAMWGIRAGDLGQADSLFLQDNLLALGWSDMKDLSGLLNDRDAFKSEYEARHPGRKTVTIRSHGGQLYRFVHEMKIGDVVIYPSLVDRLFHIGTVAGNYSYDPAKNPEYPHHRSVTWHKHLPRLDFTQGARYEAGAGTTLFSIRSYAMEFNGALQNQPPTSTTNSGSGVATGVSSTSSSASAVVASDSSNPLIADNIEQITRDYILQRLGQNLKGHPLAGFVAHLLEIMGFRTRVSPPGPDGGVDIIAHKDEFGLFPPIIKVQVKSTGGAISNADVGFLNGILATTEHGLLITLGTFTSPARTAARGMSKLRLIDGGEFADLVLQHYDALDPRYKGLMPLKKVYVPEEPEDTSS